jgi:hypothetical protein
VSIRRCLIVLGAAAALFAGGGPAFADGHDLLDGSGQDSGPLVNNVTIAPVQMCGSGAALGVFDHPPTQHAGNCTNAPTGDPLQELITNSALG